MPVLGSNRDAIESPTRAAKRAAAALSQASGKDQVSNTRLDSRQCLILLLSCLVTGCATTLSASAQRVKIANAHEVSKCEFVTDIEGWSGWAGSQASIGMQNAMNEAVEQAAAAKATHVVLTSDWRITGSFATGTAYRCD